MEPSPPSASPPKPSDDQEKLLDAVCAGDIALIETLLKKPDVRADFVYPLRGTCLEVACRTPLPTSDTVVQLLLGKVEPNVYEIKPEAIHYAAEKGNHKALRELLRDKRTRVNAEKSDGRTALHLAAKNFKNNPGHYSICLEILLECPSLDINRPNGDNCTAIIEAAEFGGKEAVVKMLQLRPFDFDLDSEQSLGRTARRVILSKFPDLEPLLPSVKVTTLQTSDPQALLLEALLNRNLDVFKGLLQQVDQDGTSIMDPNYIYRQPYRTTCLNEACADSSLYEYLQALLRANANPNLVNVATSKAPIHVAISRKNLPAVRLLLDKPTLNVNVRDKHGDSPLHYVVQFVDDDDEAELRVKEMIKYGADVNVKNDEGNTAVMAAALRRRKDLVMAMLPETDIEEEVEVGVTLKSFLQTHLPDIGDLVNVYRRNSDLMKRLKRKLFFMLYEDNCDGFVNDLQKSTMNEQQLKDLLNGDDGNNSFLQTACMLSHPNSVVEVLLQIGVDPNGTIKENSSPPLVMAAERKKYDVMKIMLELAEDQVDVNKNDGQGNTALHVVAKKRNLEMVVRLLNAGAKMDIKNNLGKEPISTAAMKDLMDMSLQADQTLFPSNSDYKIEMCFGLFIQKQKRQAQPASATESAEPILHNQKDVELAPLNGLPQFGKSSSSAGAMLKGRRGAVQVSEAARLCYITETYNDNSIIKHPLVKSFIFLKWPKIRAYYYTNLVIVILFTLFLNAYIILGCNENDTCSENVSISLMVLTTIFWASIVFRELLQLLTTFRSYTSRKANILDVALIVFTPCCLFVKWDLDDVRLTYSVVTVILSWLELFVVSGRMPVLSEYMEILKTVAINFLFFLSWYSMLLVSFALCFYLLLRANNDSFSTVGISFFSVISMMIGEVNTDNVKFNSVPLLSYSVFAAFIFLVTIVLLNLLNGLAISGIQEIKEAASLLSTQSHVWFIRDIEHALINIYKRKIPLLSRVLSLDKIMIFPVDGDTDYFYVFPNINSYTLLEPSEQKHSMDLNVIWESMKIVGEKSVTTTEGIKSMTKRSLKSAVQKIQELLLEIQLVSGSTNTVNETS